VEERISDEVNRSRKETREKNGRIWTLMPQLPGKENRSITPERKKW
jgi:hypothetical protein